MCCWYLPLLCLSSYWKTSTVLFPWMSLWKKEFSVLEILFQQLLLPASILKYLQTAAHSLFLYSSKSLLLCLPVSHDNATCPHPCLFFPDDIAMFFHAPLWCYFKNEKDLNWGSATCWCPSRPSLHMGLCKSLFSW